MAENYDLIFGQSASQQYAWSDSDYQNGWQTVGSTPPTAEQFDALQRKSDTKAKDLNDRLEPIEEKAEVDGRQAATTYRAGAMLTVDGLPNGWLLECIVPGISGTDAITLPDTLIDGLTIIDGDVTWALRKVATNGGIGYRQPNTAYTAGQIAYHSALPTGYYLECTTQGITGSSDITPSSTIGSTVSDGAVTWKVCKDIGTGNAPIYAGFNQKQTFTSSGSFTAPVTGMYKITLQGGGGGGAGAGNMGINYYCGGGGGGQGGHLEFFEKLIAGTSNSFTIGAGGTGGKGFTDNELGTTGNYGGTSEITINGNNYKCFGGAQGTSQSSLGSGGVGGEAVINGAVISRGCSGSAGMIVETGVKATYTPGGGIGGGGGGSSATVPGNTLDNQTGFFGGGGAGGLVGTSRGNDGGNGGNGYITFEWLDPTLL